MNDTTIAQIPLDALISQLKRIRPGEADERHVRRIMHTAAEHLTAYRETDAASTAAYARVTAENARLLAELAKAEDTIRDLENRLARAEAAVGAASVKRSKGT